MSSYRVMVEQETGEEMCLANGLSYEAADSMADEALETHKEWRQAWVEPEGRYAHLGYQL